MLRPLPSAFLLAAALLLSACSGAEEAAAPADAPADAPAAEEAAAPTEAAAPAADEAAAGDAATAGLSGVDFVAQAESLAGSTVTLGRCALMTEPISDGSLGCRVVDEDGKDVKTPDDLPVDVFFKEADLSAEAKAVMAAACPDGFCDVQLTGTLAVAPATFYVSMTDVVLAPID